MLDFPKNRILSPKPSWTVSLNDYITAIAWSNERSNKSANESDLLAIASASGEVQVGSNSKDLRILHLESNQSVDALEFSSNWLAAAGQEGKINLWNLKENIENLTDRSAKLPTMSLDRGSAWIDRLAWQPPQKISNGISLQSAKESANFAFNLGKFVQVWSVDRDIVTTVDFENSSVQALAWHPDGNLLAVGGYQGVKIWNATDWDNDPYILPVPTAISAIAWNALGDCLIVATTDETVIFLNYTDLNSQAGDTNSLFELSPFQLSGFPSKIKAISWADSGDTFAVASGTEISVWQPHINPNNGWEAEIFNQHLGKVNALEFKPQTKILASADVNGKILLSKGGKNIQTLNANAEVTCLKWHPQGHKLAAGTEQGQVSVWDLPKKSSTKGFWV